MGEAPARPVQMGAAGRGSRGSVDPGPAAPVEPEPTPSLTGVATPPDPEAEARLEAELALALASQAEVAAEPPAEAPTTPQEQPKGKRGRKAR